MTAIKIRRLDAEEVWHLAAALRPLLQKGLSYGPAVWDVDDVIEQAQKNQVVIWVAIHRDWPRSPDLRMVMVTRVNEYPKAKILFVEILAGKDLSIIEDGYRRVADWAMEQGCTVIQAVGRNGWSKVTGWKTMMTIWREL